MSLIMTVALIFILAVVYGEPEPSSCECDERPNDCRWCNQLVNDLNG